MFMAVFMSHHPIEPDVRPARGARVHLMLTCLCDAFYPEVGIAAQYSFKTFEGILPIIL
jgi:hypothetical protein